MGFKPKHFLSSENHRHLTNSKNLALENTRLLSIWKLYQTPVSTKTTKSGQERVQK